MSVSYLLPCLPQGIISSDGFRLPLAVYNSLLPLLQLRGARILQLVIQHFGKCSTLMQFAQLVSDLCTTVLEKASWRGISGAVMAQALQADSLLESKDEVSSGGWPTLQPKADAAGNTAPQTAPTIELEHDGIENGGIRDQSLLVLALRCSLAWDQCLGSGLGRQFGRVLLIACVRLIHTAIRVNASHSMLQIVSGAVGGQGSKVHGGGKRKRQRVSVATHQSATKPASEEAGGQEQNASKGDYFSLTGDDEAAGTAADFKTVGAASPSAIAVILALQNLEQVCCTCQASCFMCCVYSRSLSWLCTDSGAWVSGSSHGIGGSGSYHHIGNDDSACGQGCPYCQCNIIGSVISIRNGYVEQRSWRKEE